MLIKDEIHGTIEFDELEERIIDSRPFQRLRRIKQMSVTNLVYPGANHTRFEHSLGTAHLSYVIASRLGLDKDTIRMVKLYGLLHDIGHTAFSHEGEDVVGRYIGNHEELGRKKIIESEIADILSENYNPKKIADIGKSSYGSIISSDIGADRMDYLKRDALNTGVAYGIIDTDRIIHTLQMDEENGGGLCIDKGGLEAAEYLLIARFMMFSAVYMHRTVRIATAMLYRAMEEAINDKTLKPEKLSELDDESALIALSKSAKGRLFAMALIERKLFKQVYSFPTKDWSEKKSREAERKISLEAGTRVLVDYPHRFFKQVGFKVRTEEGLKDMSELSTIVQSLKKAEEDRMRVLVLADEKIRKDQKEVIVSIARKIRLSAQ